MPIATPPNLGRYQILDEIGRGAMGVVYLAKDPLIGRLVALKTFRLGSALAGRELETFRARFIREAQSAGILSHPNIVTIHDVVEQSEEGATFIAMEYVRGTDLKEMLAGGNRLELDEAVHIVSAVAEGLAYAHSKGVVHRDVKPANILITEERQVKLTDFGIARLEASNLTLEGQLLGTPNYMAPEQIQGHPTDARADVFSLGVVLYEMLTGEKPFKGENVTVVTHRIVYDDYTSPTELVGHVPEALLAVLAKALAKDPDERYPSVREMAEALRSAAAELRAAERLNDTRVIFDPRLLDPPEPPPRPRPATAPPRPARAAWAGAGGAGTRLGAQLGAKLGAKLGAAARSGLGAAAGAVRSGLRGLARALARARLPAGAMPPLPRLALVAAVAAASAALLGGLLLFAAARGAAEPAAEPPAEHRQRLAAVPHLRSAHLRLEEGDPLAALAYLRQAERAAPDLPEVRARRRQVEEQARSLDRLEERVDQVAEGLEEARIAAEQERWEEAGRAARAVLAVEPENREAREIAGRAGSTLARIARRRAAETPSPAAAAAPREDEEGPAAAPEPAGPAGPAAPEAVDQRAAPTGRSRLELYFYSAVPEGVLTVYVGEEQLLRESFRFYRKESFFRVVPAAGEIENSYTVPSGEATIRVLVALPGRPALSRVLEGELPDAGGRRLTVRLSEDRTLTARLE